MQLVARLKNVNEIETLHQLGVDGFCVDTPFSTKKVASFDKFELQKIRKGTLKNNQKMYVLINSFVHEENISDISAFFKELIKIQVDGIIINDLTIYVLAKQFQLDHLIIYQPGTFNTDSFSVDYFSQRKILGITLSREITLSEIQQMVGHQSSIEFSLIVHGYLDMFYSKRKLISRYLEHKHINGKDIKNNVHLRLNEEIRPNDYYPILEDEYGTHIFRSKKLISVDELKQLKEKLHMIFLERIFMSDEEYYDSIKLYKNNISKEEFLKKYKDYDSGFYYRRTEKVKGELNES